MIKVIIERHTNNATELLRLLRDIRIEAMKRPGYISGETLVNSADRSTIVVISTWESMKGWKDWEATKTRAKIEEQIDALLTEKPKVTTYSYLSYQPSRSKTEEAGQRKHQP